MSQHTERSWCHPLQPRAPPPVVWMKGFIGTAGGLIGVPLRRGTESQNRFRIQLQRVTSGSDE